MSRALASLRNFASDASASARTRAVSACAFSFATRSASAEARTRASSVSAWRLATSASARARSTWGSACAGLSWAATTTPCAAIFSGAGSGVVTGATGAAGGTGIAGAAAVTVVFPAPSLAPNRNQPACHATAAPISSNTSTPSAHGMAPWERAGGAGAAAGAVWGTNTCSRNGAPAPETR